VSIFAQQECREQHRHTRSRSLLLELSLPAFATVGNVAGYQTNSSKLMIMDFINLPNSDHRQFPHWFKVILLSLAMALWSLRVLAQEQIVFRTEDGALIYTDLYGQGSRGLVLAHGGQFNKESWRKQAQQFVASGFQVLAFDFRGYGESGNPDVAAIESMRHLDVVAAVEYLHDTGADNVAIIGASMGGDYAATAAEANPQLVERLVLIASGAYTPLLKSQARKLFIMSRDDIIGDNSPRMPAIRSQYENAVEPKEFVELEGSAHAQFIFATPQGERLLREILRFLSAP